MILESGRDQSMRPDSLCATSTTLLNLLRNPVHKLPILFINPFHIFNIYSADTASGSWCVKSKLFGCKKQVSFSVLIEPE
jgi:hypothetical protein